MAQTGLEAEDGKTTPPAAAKTREAVNVMWRCDGNGHFPEHPSALRVVGRQEYSLEDARGDRRLFFADRRRGQNLRDGRNGQPHLPRPRRREGPLAEGPLQPGQQRHPGRSLQETDAGVRRREQAVNPHAHQQRQTRILYQRHGALHCYDLQGNRKWIRVIETAEDEERFCSSPIFLGDRIILSWGGLLALSAKDGSTLWKAAAAKPTFATPAIAHIGGEAVAVTPAGDIVRLADGEILCSGLFESPYTTPLVEGRALYVIDGKALAWELPAKAEKGLRPKEIWKTPLTGTFMASPVYRDGLIYTVEKRCRLHIIDAKTGKVFSVSRVVDEATKTEKIESGTKIAGLAPAHYVYASPAASERNLFFFDDAGHAAVLELGRAYKLVRVNKIDDGFSGTPFFFKDKIIIRGSQTVYCIGAKH